MIQSQSQNKQKKSQIKTQNYCLSKILETQISTMQIEIFLKIK